MIGSVTPAYKAIAVYGKQQYYAERSRTLHLPKTVQVGQVDRVTLSKEALTAMASKTPPVAVVAKSVKAITYEDPRKLAKPHATKSSENKEKKESDATTSAIEVSEFEEGIVVSISEAGGEKNAEQEKEQPETRPG